MFRPLTPSRVDDFAHVQGAGGPGQLATGSLYGGSAVEAYPRAGGKRVIHDVWAWYGTEAMFERGGFKKVRGRVPVPKGWTPRVTMRATCTMPRT